MTQELNRVEDSEYYKDKENCYQKKDQKVRKPRSSNSSIGESGFLVDITAKTLKDAMGKGGKRVNRFSGFGVKVEDEENFNAVMGQIEEIKELKPEVKKVVKFR